MDGSDPEGIAMIGNLGRLSVILFLLGIGLLGNVGCSHFDFATYQNLDDWYVGLEHQLEPGFRFEDSSVGFYYLNTLLRTPVFVLHDVSRIAVIPVAASYYAFGFLSGDDEEKGAASQSDSS